MEIDVRQFSSDKILKHLDRVNQWLKGENPPPITVELDMTNVCNHNCPKCVGGYFQHRNQQYLPKYLAEDIIRQLAKATICGLIFTGGGEPLCHPHTGEMVKLAHVLGLDIGFITNGSLINEEIAQILLQCCRWVRISIDAATAKTFEKIHGVDGKAFHNVIDNTRLLTKMKQNLKSRTTIGIGYLTCDYTKEEMYEAAKLYKQLNVDYLQFRPMQVYDNDEFQYHWSDVTEEIYKCMKGATDGYKVLYSKHKYEMMKDKRYGRNYKKCYGHQFATEVAADGKMYLCCHTRGHEKYCIGELRKNTFKEIWNSKRRQEVAQNIDFRDCIPLCRDNTFNQILWNIKQPKQHVNFL